MLFINLPVLFSKKSSMSLGSKNEDLGVWGGDIFLPSQQSCLPLCPLVCSPFNFQFQLKCLFHSVHWNDVPTSRKNQLHSFSVSSSLWLYFEVYHCAICFYSSMDPHCTGSKLVYAAGSQFIGAVTHILAIPSQWPVNFFFTFPMFSFGSFPWLQTSLGMKCVSILP